MRPRTIKFDSLVTKYSASLKPMALKLTRNTNDAQDLLQETALKALYNRDKFSKGTNMKAWLYTIMKNIFINDYRRKKKIQALLDYSAPPAFKGLSGTISNDGISHMEIASLRLEIEKLNGRIRQPFMLFSQGFKICSEIASQLHLPIGTVKSRIHFARMELKQSWIKLNQIHYMA